MNRKGFTLLELSIVVVIIGLLIGFILKGTVLINNARAKRVITDATTLVDAQNSYFQRTGSFAGDNDNDGAIDFQNLSGATLDDSAASSGDADYPFIALKNVKLLGGLSDKVLAATQNSGYMYYSGGTVTDSAGNTSPVNMVVIRGVTCLSAFFMELNLDNDTPDSTNSASTGRVRFISSGALLSSGAWTASNVCGTNSSAVTNIALLFGKY